MKKFLVVMVLTIAGCHRIEPTHEVHPESKVKEQLTIETTFPVHAEPVVPKKPFQDLYEKIPPKHPCIRYTEDIFRSTYEVFGEEPIPLLFLNQFFQESKCDPTAKSGAGAQGFGQIMPRTQMDLKQRFGYEMDAWDAAENIYGAILLSKSYRKSWDPKTRPYCDLNMYMLGCYNGGCGYWFKAQKICSANGDQKNCNQVMEIAPFYPQANKAGTKENLWYIAKISGTWNKMQPNACPMYPTNQFIPKGTP